MKHSTLTINRILAPIVFGAAFALYVVTLAPSVVPGDPAEYQFIPHILGIAHPPGYMFYTVLAKIWTSVVRLGSVAYRTNLLSAAAGAWTVLMAFEMVWLLWNRASIKEPRTETLNRDQPDVTLDNRISRLELPRALPALFAAAVLATSTDHWQHSIHANSHIVSAALAATTLYCGLCWWATGRDRWLYGFGFFAALGVTHHPLLAFGAPAYVVFVLAVRPRLLFDVRRLGGLALAVLFGLSVFLYLPLRAGATPFGPSPNLDAILGHATARGIRGNLFHFGIADQPVRLRVFWELLKLQYATIALALVGCGLIWLAWRRRQPFLLFSTYLVFNLAFIINTVQDVMAYLLLPFTVIAVLAGCGVATFLAEGHSLLRQRRWQRAVIVGLAVFVLLGPIGAAAEKLPRLSLRDYRYADSYIDAVFEQFEGKGAQAVLLAPWEGITPLAYAEQVEGRRLDQQDVKVVFVASGTANPWVENVWKHIEDGPIYLVDYRPQVAAEGFRLRPVGSWPFYAVEPPPATSMPQIGQKLDITAGDAIRVLGWDLDRSSVLPGETAYLTLYFKASRELRDFFMPYVQLSGRDYRWTTDGRLNTPWWLPAEIVVERYEITIPFGMPPGDYPLKLGISNLSQGQDIPLSNGRSTIELSSSLHVKAAAAEPSEGMRAQALANLNSRIVLLGGRAIARGQTADIPWSEPLHVQPGDKIQTWLDWRALRSVDEPYTVFVHLIDGSGRVWAQQDYTPMGGAFPTFLWIPRWIEGQTVSDPYQLIIPSDAPPGDYWIEVGMYGMTSLRRVYHFDAQGNLVGDRYIAGPVRVGSP